MKIVHCLNHFLPKQVAGTEMYTFSLSKELISMGHQVVVLIPNFDKSINETYDIAGIRIICYAETSVVDRGLLQGKRKPDGLNAFMDVLKYESPDIVHFHEMTGSNGITIHHLIAAKQAGFKTIMTFHLAGYSCNTGTLMYNNKELCDGLIQINKCSWCSYSNKQLPFFKQGMLFLISQLFYRIGYDTRNWQSSLGTAMGYPLMIDRLKDSLLVLANNCDKLVTISHWYKKILMLNGVASDRICFIAQGLSAKSTVGREEQNTPVLKLVFIGRITRIKGLLLLIQALKDLPLQKVTLDIYGQVNEIDYYLECQKNTEALTNIKWMGSFPNEQVINILSKYDILCLPSEFSEMSPLVIQEAFAAGLSVIASNVYGNAEQVTHGENGWLFQFKQVDDLKSLLHQLIGDPDKITRARMNLPDFRSFKKVAEEYNNLYSEVLVS